MLNASNEEDNDRRTDIYDTNAAIIYRTRERERERRREIILWVSDG
jgi:hypothetical protein